jgi:hypothetical protein
MKMVKAACPITGRMCLECAIYRGRHFYLCFEKDEESKQVLRDIWAQHRLEENPDGTYGIAEFFNMPDSPTWLHNIEDVFFPKK